MSLAFARRLTVQSLSSCKRVGVGVGGARRWKSDTCKVLTISSGKGGVGKTTTAASFSYGLAKKVCYCFTTSLPHYLTALLLHFIALLNHNITASLHHLPYCTVLLHYFIITLLHQYFTALLRYCFTALLLCRITVSLLYKDWCKICMSLV
jgi:hypothetical protein